MIKKLFHREKLFILALCTALSSYFSYAADADGVSEITRAGEFLGLQEFQFSMTGAPGAKIVLNGKKPEILVEELSILEPGKERPIVTTSGAINPTHALHKLLSNL